MMPRTGSYGDTPTVTRSPGTTLIRKRRIRPLSWASTSWPASHCTRYSPPLWTATTVPCMSIRSSLLNRLAILSLQPVIVSEAAHRVFHLRRQRLVVVPGQPKRRAERHANAARPGHFPRRVQHPVEPVDPDRDDRHVQPRADHADPR